MRPNGEGFHAQVESGGDAQYTAKNAAEVIRWAIDQAGIDGKVLLRVGTYPLDQQIDLVSRLTLMGEGAGTVLWMTPEHATGTAIKGENVDKVLVADLAIKTEAGNEQGRVGVLLQQAGDCLVRDIFCLGMKEYGIWIREHCFLTEIRSCRLAACEKAGVFADNLFRDGRGGDFLPNLITNCIAYRCGVGFETKKAIVLHIVACMTHQCLQHGILLRDISNSVLVSGCRTYQTGGDAVVVRDSHEINIIGNTISWHVGHGIVLDNSIWGTISGNNIIDSGSTNMLEEARANGYDGSQSKFHKLETDVADIPLHDGIHIVNGSAGLTLTGNAIFNWPVCPPMEWGISEDASCRSNLMTGNNINYCKEGGIESLGTGSQESTNLVVVEHPLIHKSYGTLQFYDPTIIDEVIEQLR